MILVNSGVHILRFDGTLFIRFHKKKDAFHQRTCLYMSQALQRLKNTTIILSLRTVQHLTDSVDATPYPPFEDHSEHERISVPNTAVIQTRQVRGDVVV